MEEFIKELLHSDTLFIFDFDGTIIECRYGVGHLNILGVENKDSELIIRDLNKDVYKNKKPISGILKLINNIKSHNRPIKILTQIHNGIELQNKMNWVEDNNICKGKDVIGTICRENKITVLEHYSKKYNNVIYIDDDVSALINFQEYFNENNIRNCHCFHISSFLV